MHVAAHHKYPHLSVVHLVKEQCITLNHSDPISGNVVALATRGAHYTDLNIFVYSILINI